MARAPTAWPGVAMAELYTAVDLSRLPPPAIVETLDFDTIYAEMLADLRARVPDFDATLESDPAVAILQVAAYRELLIRQRVNDAAQAVMVAYATGTDLDHLAALFGVARLMISPADPVSGTAAVLESDTALRRRLTLAPEGYSVAGPAGAYVFHALSADPRVLDAAAASPSPGQVVVTVLARDGNGTAPGDLVAAVAAYLTDETRRPLTDQVLVTGAQIVPFAIDATVTYLAGPDPSIVASAFNAQLAVYLARARRLGFDITRSSIMAALTTEGVQNVVLASPAADIVLSRAQAAWCTGVTVNGGGTAE